MDFSQAGKGGRGRGGGDRDGESELIKSARAQTLRYSNFLLTISTNVVPKNDDEKMALAQWLMNNCIDMFWNFDVLNGNCIKPAGTSNREKVTFPLDNKIIKIRSRIAVEQGDMQRGQIHAHVLLEIAHEYLEQEDRAEGGQGGKANIGVHINVVALREWFNSRIPEMLIERSRWPPKIYINSKLLTTGTDNSNKFLTLQYLNKDRAKDIDGGVRNLVEDRAEAPTELQQIHQTLLHGSESVDVAPAEGSVMGGLGDPTPKYKPRAQAQPTRRKF